MVAHSLQQQVMQNRNSKGKITNLLLKKPCTGEVNSKVEVQNSK
jgi:hypothetical protein